MRALVYIICLFLSGAVSAEWTLGLGLGSHLRRDVNPANSSLLSLAQIFAQYEYRPFSLSLEVSQARHQTSSGLLAVDARSLNTLVWGRYDLADLGGFRPLLSLGTGMSFDRVTSTYAGQNDTRHGQRWINGVGAGGRYVSWKYVAWEGEVRLLLIPDQRDPEFGFTLRAGVVF